MTRGRIARSAIEAAVKAAGRIGLRTVRQVPSLSGNAVFDVRTRNGERLAVRYLMNAAAVAREQLIAERVRDVVPVPEILLADPTGRAAGHPTLVAQWIEGLPLDIALTQASNADITKLGYVVGKTLGRLPGIELAAPGWLPGPTLDVEPREHGLAEGVRRHVRHRLFDTDGGRQLDTEVRQRFWRLVNSRVDALDVLDGDRFLVHGDLLRRNIIVRVDGIKWTLAGLLDWEFALSGPTLRDVGNVCRAAPLAFASALEAGLRTDARELPVNWRELAWLLDIVSLTGPLARPAGHPDRALACHMIDKAARTPGAPWEAG